MLDLSRRSAHQDTRGALGPLLDIRHGLFRCRITSRRIRLALASAVLASPTLYPVSKLDAQQLLHRKKPSLTEISDMKLLGL